MREREGGGGGGHGAQSDNFAPFFQSALIFSLKYTPQLFSAVLHPVQALLLPYTWNPLETNLKFENPSKGPLSSV